MSNAIPFECDVAIVGGGAAGCVLAARLSENPTLRVVLLEAGKDTPPGNVPADIRDAFPISYSNPEYFWPGLLASARSGRSGEPFPQARVMGGGSSVMGMWALRGLPGDYDAWAASGATGWGWSDVLPAFNRLEHDLDYDGPLHGDSGPIPIRRNRHAAWPEFVHRLALAGKRNGLQTREDINSDFADGIFPVPLTNDAQGRVSAASGYLTGEVRRRPNLAVVPGALVERIVLRERRAVGVSLHCEGGNKTISAHETILAAGALYSPMLLLRSGIGPAEDLRAVGINVAHDLPGVGAGLQNHCVVNFGMQLVRSARQAQSLRSYGLACARLSSHHPQGTAGDLHLQFVARSSVYPHGDRFGVVGAALYAPLSRGRVSLTRQGGALRPEIVFDLLMHPADRARLGLAVASALRLLQDRAVEQIRGDIFTVLPSSMIRRLNRPSRIHHLMSAALAMILDAPEPFRRLALSRAGRMLSKPLDKVSPDALADLATPIFHPVGSCAIGHTADRGSTLDSDCRVRGISGLRIMDASIMPRIPTANTCLPTMMIAEHGAARFLRAR